MAAAVVVALSEEECASDNIDAVKSLLSGVDPALRFLSFVGSTTVGQLLCDELAVDKGRYTYVGPSTLELSPAWWWGWTRAAQIATEAHIVTVLHDRVASVVPGRTDGPAAMSIWASLAATSHRPPSLCVQLKAWAVSLRAEACPKSAKPAVERIAEYADAISVFLDLLYVRQNETSRSSYLTHSGYTNGLLQISTEATSLKTAIAALSWSPVDAGPLLAAELHHLVGSPSPSGITSTWSLRLRAWSALLLARAVFLVDEGRPTESVLFAWRALETYAYMLGLGSNLLSVSAAGAWCWGSASKNTGPIVAINKLIQELRLLSMLTAETSDVNSLRDFRNKSVLGHGWIGSSVAHSNDAIALVRKVIEAQEGSSSPWVAAFLTFQRLPDLRALPATIEKYLGI